MAYVYIYNAEGSSIDSDPMLYYEAYGDNMYNCDTWTEFLENNGINIDGFESCPACDEKITNSSPIVGGHVKVEDEDSKKNGKICIAPICRKCNGKSPDESMLINEDYLIIHKYL